MSIASVLPIDDPLSHGTLAGSFDPKSVKGRIRPFSLGDNNALERAWLSLISSEDGKVHQEAKTKRKLSPPIAKANSERLAQLVRNLATKHFTKHGGDLPSQSASALGSGLQPTTPAPVCCPELYLDTSSELQNAFCALARARQGSLGQDNVIQAIMMELKLLQIATLEASPSDRPGQIPQTSGRTRAGSSPTASVSMPMVRPGSSHAEAVEPRQTRLRSNSQRVPEEVTRSRIPATSGPRSIIDNGISGKPFVRVGSPDPTVDSLPASLPTSETVAVPPSQPAVADVEVNRTREEAAFCERDTKEVAVGISRLHMVSIPALQMKPIYWSPVNDIAVVMRATWFYRYGASKSSVVSAC